MTTLESWTRDWSEAGIVNEGLAVEIRHASERIGEPEQPSLEHTFRTAGGPRRDELIAERERIRAEITGLDTDIEKTAKEREGIEAQRDEAPPENDLRIADRAGRVGAPFWRLVRFHDHVSAENAASIEGALYGSGMLTAWLHPDHADTHAALQRTEPDAYLLPLPEADRPDGPSLADYLAPEEQA